MNCNEPTAFYNEYLFESTCESDGQIELSYSNDDILSMREQFADFILNSNKLDDWFEEFQERKSRIYVFWNS